MVTHDDILEELRRWVIAGRVSQKEIATELEIAPARVSEMLNGRRKVQQREMPILVRYFGMDEAPHPSIRKAKRIGLVPAGSLREALAEATGTIDVPGSLPKGVFALHVDGESMNKLAPYGCDVIVDPDDKSLFANDLYVVGNGQGEVTFKRFVPDPARLVPMSDDPTHTDIPLGAEPINIIGRVVSVLLSPEHLRRVS